MIIFFKYFYKKGINLLRYKIPIEGLENATNYPPNKDFYQFGHNGIQNLTNCEKGNNIKKIILNIFKGVPIFISKPHFLDGPWYQKRVIGINPNSSIHNTFLDIEPVYKYSFFLYYYLLVYRNYNEFWEKNTNKYKITKRTNTLSKYSR